MLELQRDIYLNIHTKDTLYVRCTDRFKICQYNNYFEALFRNRDRNGEIHFSIDFPTEVVRACLDLFEFAASIKPNRFVENAAEYEKKTDERIESIICSKFVDILQCLDFFNTDQDFIKDLLRLYKYDPKDFDMATFTEINSVPANCKWGYWSVYGEKDSKPPSEKPWCGNLKPESYEFIPVSRNMDTYGDYTVCRLHLVEKRGTADQSTEDGYIRWGDPIVDSRLIYVFDNHMIQVKTQSFSASELHGKYLHLSVFPCNFNPIYHFDFHKDKCESKHVSKNILIKVVAVNPFEAPIQLAAEIKAEVPSPESEYNYFPNKYQEELHVTKRYLTDLYLQGGELIFLTKWE